LTTPTLRPAPTASNETVIDNNTSFSSAAGFNIAYPKTLKVATNDTNASVQITVYVYLAKNNTIDAVNVETHSLTANDTLQDFTTSDTNASSTYPDYKLISNQSATLGGKQAYIVVWQAAVPVQIGNSVSDIQNTPLKVMQIYVIYNNKGYVITYKAVSGDYNTYLAQAQQIMNSFKFNSRSNG
jgi:hypothetical protein